MRPERLYLTHRLMESYGLLDGEGVILKAPLIAEVEDILRVHTDAYFSVLRGANDGDMFPENMNHGLGYGDNPVFEGVFDWSMRVCGGTLSAVREVASGNVARSFHTGGGLHHAHRDRAAGFCYLNDAAVAIAEQVEKGLRVFYLDIDAHHGDGVQEFFYDTDRVFTLSIHESGRFLFPGTGSEIELGEGVGYGFSVNIPLLPGSGDQVYREAFDAAVLPLLRSFEPDIVVLQLGVDTMYRDPLAHLNLTTEGFVHVLQGVLDLFPSNVVALGGGGYDMDTVARSWTLAWGTLTGRTLPDPLPEVYLSERTVFKAGANASMTLRDTEALHMSGLTDHLGHLRGITDFLRENGIIRV